MNAHITSSANKDSDCSGDIGAEIGTRVELLSKQPDVELCDCFRIQHFVFENDDKSCVRTRKERGRESESLCKQSVERNHLMICRLLLLLAAKLCAVYV